MTVLLYLCSGCSRLKDIRQDDPFRELYNAAALKQVKSSKTIVDTRKLNLSANKMELPSFCRLLSDHFGVGIVFSDKLVNNVITAEFKDTDLNTVFTVLSRQLGVDVVNIGNTYYLGELREEDRGVLIRRVLSHDEENLQQLLETLKSGSGKSKVLSGRVVIVADKDFVIRRISEALDQIEGYDLSSWIIQLYFLVLRKDALAEGGLTMSTSGTISYNISENTIDVKDFKIEGLFSGLFESSYADLYASPMFVLRDGVKGTWFDGQNVPVPRKTVSDYGTVTTSGFDYIDTGLEVTASCRESKAGGYLELNIGLSDIQSYVEGTPLTSRTKVNVALDMVPNKIYLLSELQRYSLLDREENTFLLARNKGKSTIQVWGRIYKTGAPKKYDLPKMDETQKDIKNLLNSI